MTDEKKEGELISFASRPYRLVDPNQTLAGIMTFAEFGEKTWLCRRGRHKVKTVAKFDLMACLDMDPMIAPLVIGLYSYSGDLGQCQRCGKLAEKRTLW